jgi:predicted nucleotidyltransferase component of viral defense system
MVWVMHRFAEHFGGQAVLKGGMALRLYDCPRSTTDVDYVFVPFNSKKPVAAGIRQVLSELADASVDIQSNSKTVRATIELDGARIQVEASAASECRSVAMSTSALGPGEPPRVVRVMSPEVALAHKLAAWNERRLVRDMYDSYYLHGRIRAEPDMDVLRERLARVDSRLPALRRVKRMSLARFADEFERAVETVDEDLLAAELGPLLPAAELAGLPGRIRAALTGLVARLREQKRA